MNPEPPVILSAGVLELGDRAAHQLRPQLGVVAVGVAAHLTRSGVRLTTGSVRAGVRT